MANNYPANRDDIARRIKDNAMRLNTFMNTSAEQHAFVIGLFEVLCPWTPRVRITSHPKRQGQPEGDQPSNTVIQEYHYYLFGRGLGFVILPLALAGIARLIQLLFW